MFRLFAPDFTSILLWRPKHNCRVRVKFNLQPNKSRYSCLLSNNIKMSRSRIARFRSYLEHPYSFGCTHLEHPLFMFICCVYRAGREAGICVVWRVWLQFSVSYRCLIRLDSVQAILHMDMCTRSVILVRFELSGLLQFDFPLSSTSMSPPPPSMLVILRNNLAKKSPSQNKVVLWTAWWTWHLRFKLASAVRKSTGFKPHGELLPKGLKRCQPKCCYRMPIPSFSAPLSVSGDVGATACPVIIFYGNNKEETKEKQGSGIYSITNHGSCSCFWMPAVCRDYGPKNF